MMDRIGTTLETLTRPCAGLIEDMERDDDLRGPEPEPESVARTSVRRSSKGGWTTWL
ncbi:hypothetical protein [Streptomyces sp. NPDC054863]